MSHSMRTRLVVALCGTAVGVLALAGSVTYLLVEASATQSALSDLEEQAPTVNAQIELLLQNFQSLNDEVQATGRPTSVNLAQLKLRFTRSSLIFAGANLVQITAEGEVNPGQTSSTPLSANGETGKIFDLPAGLEASDLNIDALIGGASQSGQRGQLVFVATAINIDQENKAGGEDTSVVIISRSVNSTVFDEARPYLTAAAGAALFVALVISLLLARRLTRPLAEIQRAAMAFGEGDLGARADLGTRADDEFAALAGTLNTMAIRLQEARNLERDFLLSISHDLRTPLTSIRGYAEAIADGTVSGEDAQARAGTIVLTEARRLERLVGDLLDLARLDAHQFSLAPIPIDLSAVIADSTEAFSPVAAELGISLSVEIQSSISADLDPERVAQIVANLLENALKYASSAISVHIDTAPGQIELRVSDDGPGIAHENLSRVFDRLYTSRGTSGRKVGTGIGLAIVYELAQAMGGAAHAEQNARGGATFVVTFNSLGDNQ